MTRKASLFATLILWMATMVQCNPNLLPAVIVCPDPLKSCGDNTCYDPATQQCSSTRADSDIPCMNKCGDTCYDSFTHECTNNTVCLIGEEVCEVKYDNYAGASVQSPGLQCYDPRRQRCLNHTLCYDKDRVCNGQCILYTSDYHYRVCASDRTTLCRMSQYYAYYNFNRIRACNGTCYDTQNTLEHCVNGSLQCVFNCSNQCYDAGNQVCIKGRICNRRQDVCVTNYSSNTGLPYDHPQAECYDPWSSKCIDDALCPNERVCDGKCITGANATYTVCANDKRTTCNVKNYFDTYHRHQMHLCNGECFDSILQQCVNGSISCVDGCGDMCYDPAFQKCVNGTLHQLYEEVCEVQYDSYTGTISALPGSYWYNSRYERCLNHTICFNMNRVCNEQCIPGVHSYTHVCADDNKTLCEVNRSFIAYKPNQIQVCNGSCFDAGEPPVYQCVNDVKQCISNCSGACFNEQQSVCLNGHICPIGFNLCESVSPPQCYDPLNDTCANGAVCSIGLKLCETVSPRACYDPFHYRCLNMTLCNNNRACGGQCITNDKQVCASDKQTICNVTNRYNTYNLNQIQLCQGVCYDSSIHQCVGQSLSSPTTTTTTKSTTISTSTYSPPESCCTAKQCTNDTDCCTPRVECRCNPYSKSGDANQECKAIVVGKNNHHSFVMAIAFNDKNVVVMHLKHLVLFVLPIPSIGIVLLLIRVAYLNVVHRQGIAIYVRTIYYAVRNYVKKSGREKWNAGSKNDR